LAQTNVLEKAIDQINHYKNLSFKQTWKQKSPGDDTWSTSYDNFWASRSTDGTRYSKCISKYGLTVYQGATRISLDTSQKTYSIKHNEESLEQTPYYWTKVLGESLRKIPGRIKNMPDTVINQIACSHIKIIKADTINAHIMEDFYLNKQTSLPVHVRQFMEGKMGEGNAVSTEVSILINEITYSDYCINAKNFEDLANFTIPADFTPEQKVVPLAINDKAPDWQLINTQGETISGKQLLGAIVLLDFSSNSCGACILAVPAMKKLNQRYKATLVKIYTINTGDSKDAVKAFIAKHHIDYPILLNGGKVSKAFKITGTPNFFIIDTQGNIAGIVDGYRDDLEQKLTKAIDKLQKGS